MSEVIFGDGSYESPLTQRRVDEHPVLPESLPVREKFFPRVKFVMGGLAVSLAQGPARFFTKLAKKESLPELYPLGHYELTFRNSKSAELEARLAMNKANLEVNRVREEMAVLGLELGHWENIQTTTTTQFEASSILTAEAELAVKAERKAEAAKKAAMLDRMAARGFTKPPQSYISPEEPVIQTEQTPELIQAPQLSPSTESVEVALAS